MHLVMVILIDINSLVKDLNKRLLLSETCPYPFFQKLDLSSSLGSQACSIHITNVNQIYTISQWDQHIIKLDKIINHKVT